MKNYFAYHMKKKNPVTSAGYLAAKLSGATCASLYLKNIKFQKKRKIELAYSIKILYTSNSVSKRRRRTSPGGIAFGRRGRSGSRPHQQLPSLREFRRRGKQDVGPELAAPDEVAAIADGPIGPGRWRESKGRVLGLLAEAQEAGDARAGRRRPSSSSSCCHF